MNWIEKNILLISIIITITIGGLAPSVFAAHDSPFPRKANYFLKWTMTTGEARELAKWDVVVLDMEIQRRYPERITLMRELNPDITLLVYITPQEIRNDAAGSWSVYRRNLSAQISPESYLVDAQGSRLGWWPGTTILNVTKHAPWQDTLVSFVTTELLGSGLWDGVFYDNAWDNVTHFAGRNVDINNDGQNDPSATVDAAWREGMKYIYDETRRKSGEQYIIVGNGNTRLYTNELNGKLLENFLPFAWEPTMTTYRANHENDYEEKINIINANTSNGAIPRTNYQHMRYGLVSTILEDGFYSFDFGDQEHSQLWWYDEYDANLGQALDQAKPKNGATHYTKDIWTRDFEHGIAVLNATGKTEVVSLPGEYESIRGSQDTAVNDGSIVSNVTLSAQDAKILLKTYSKLQHVLYTNGAFARFFRPDGTRVRNGYFSFDSEYDGGAHISTEDINGSDKSDLLVGKGSKIEAWREDGALLMRIYPFTAQYKAEMRLALGDLTGDGKKELIVAPAPGSKSSKGIKVYDVNGGLLLDEFHPFGKGYIGGYSVAIAEFKKEGPGELIIGAGMGKRPGVLRHDQYGKFISQFYAYELGFNGGVNVAAGDLDGDGIDEIVTGPGRSGKTWIKVFDKHGVVDPQSNFQAYQAFGTPGIDVRVVDVDFDGKEDIIGLSDSL